MNARGWSALLCGAIAACNRYVEVQHVFANHKLRIQRDGWFIADIRFLYVVKHFMEGGLKMASLNTPSTVSPQKPKILDQLRAVIGFDITAFETRRLMLVRRLI